MHIALMLEIHILGIKVKLFRFLKFRNVVHLLAGSRNFPFSGTRIHRSNKLLMAKYSHLQIYKLVSKLAIFKLPIYIIYIYVYIYARIYICT